MRSSSGREAVGTPITLLDEDTVQAVFGGVIDEATIAIAEQRDLYNATLAAKYGKSPEAVMESVRPSGRPVAALQLEREMAQVLKRQIADLQARTTSGERRAKQAETELASLARFRARLLRRQGAVARRKRSGGKKPRR